MKIFEDQQGSIALDSPAAKDLEEDKTNRQMKTNQGGTTSSNNTYKCLLLSKTWRFGERKPYSGGKSN